MKHVQQKASRNDWRPSQRMVTSPTASLNRHARSKTLQSHELCLIPRGNLAASVSFLQHVACYGLGTWREERCKQPRKSDRLGKSQLGQMDGPVQGVTKTSKTPSRQSYVMHFFHQGKASSLLCAFFIKRRS